jgi:hypothetical protein
MKNADYRRNKVVGKLKDNVHRESPRGVKLMCGHSTQSAAVVIWPGGRK